MNIKQFYRLSQLVGEEIRKQNTNYRGAISPEERLANFFEVRAIKICRRQERDSRYYWPHVTINQKLRYIKKSEKVALHTAPTALLV